MNAKTSFSAIALALLCSSTNALAGDPVVESFDRMLSHRPNEVMPTRPLPSAADPLVDAIVVPLRDGVVRPIVPADPVAESFRRMLTHTPNHVAPPVPNDLGSDPLLAALVEPLREWLAQGARVSRHAVVGPSIAKR